MSKTLCEIFAPKDHIYTDEQYGFDFIESSTRLEEAFREFHRENPHVYNELVEMALKLRGRGRKRYGIKSLFEVIRWHRALETSDEDFKLNNNHAPYYARMIMNAVPELKDFFELRVLKYQR
jgi:hypothetical protein